MLKILKDGTVSINILTADQKTKVARLLVEHGLVISICPICERIAPDDDWPDIALKCKRAKCGDEDVRTL